MQVEPELEHDEAVARRILRKQIDLLYQNQTFAILITVPIVAALFIYFSSIISWNALEGWGILFIVIMLLRSGFSWMYFSARKNNTVNLKRAERFYLSGIVFTGIFLVHGYSFIVSNTRSQGPGPALTCRYWLRYGCAYDNRVSESPGIQLHTVIINSDDICNRRI